jgi:hypothetical protein
MGLPEREGVNLERTAEFRPGVCTDARARRRQQHGGVSITNTRPTPHRHHQALLAKVYSRRSTILPGVLAGVAGTAAMDAVLYIMYRRSGGKDGLLKWEFSLDVDNWSAVSSPGLVGKALLHRLLGRDAPERWARPTQNAVHWATGVGWSTQLALLTGARGLSLRSGLIFGSTAWLTSYVVLPFSKVYKPFWEYDYGTLAKDLGPHLVFGVTTTAVLAALTGGSPQAHHGN